MSGRLFLVYTSDNANGKSRFWLHILQVRFIFAEVHTKGANGRSGSNLMATEGSPDEFHEFHSFAEVIRLIHKKC